MSMSESFADENISNSSEPTAINNMTPGAEPAHDEDVIVIQRYDGKVRFVYRDLPLNALHSEAEKTAEAANCAVQQGPDKYWALHDAIFKNQRITGIGLAAIATMAKTISGLDTVKLDECIKSGKMADEISKDVQDANSYGVTGTPTFFINGYRLVGAQPLASFSSIIDQLLAAK